MALRSGYYGFKTKIKKKLEQVAAGWDSLMSTQAVNTVCKVYKTAQTISGGATAAIELPTITGKHVIAVSCASRGAGSPTDFTVQLSSTSDDVGIRVVNIKNTSATERTRTYIISCIYMDDEYIEVVNLDTLNNNKAASPEDVPEEVIEEEKPVTKKTTTKKTVKEGK